MTHTQDAESTTLVQEGATLSGRQIAQAAGLVMAGFILSRLLGLIRDAVIAAVFGGGQLADVYFTASRPPETIFFVVAGGALASAFIPTFVGYLAAEKHDEAWRLASSITNLISLILIVISALGAIFAKQVVAIILAPSFDPQQTALTADMMRIMLLSPTIFGISGLLMGILNAHQRFLMPALAPALYNVGIIFGAVVLSPSMGIYGLAWGTVIGAALHLAIQLPALFQLHPQYRLSIDLKNPGVWEVARLMGPRVLGLAIVQINFWVELILASGMVEGSISALRRAFFVMLLPQGVIAQSVAIAVFPTFSSQAAKGDREGLQHTLGQVLRAVLFLSIPATVGLIVLRLPIVRLILERGEFNPTDSQATAWALLFYALGLVSHSLVEIVTRAFYALHDTRTPVIVGGGAMILNIIFSLALIQVMGIPGSLERGPFAGLALANTLATTFEGLALLALIRPRVGGLEGRKTASSVLKAGLASVAMGLLLWALMPLVDQLGLAIGTIGLIAMGGALFWGIAWLLGSEEARMFTNLIVGRFRPKRAD
jgi:putative peptidoglycan lipid II flippase